jgi:hypothetical protein
MTHRAAKKSSIPTLLTAKSYNILRHTKKTARVEAMLANFFSENCRYFLPKELVCKILKPAMGPLQF